MSHLLHTYVAEQLGQWLAKRRVVVWFDPRSEFVEFVRELGGGDDQGPIEVSLGDVRAHLVTYDGSVYSMRARVEPLVNDVEPGLVVMYLAGLTRDAVGSPFMELELAGTRWEPQLKQLARNALRQRFTDGVVDELLNRHNLTYLDLVAAIGGMGSDPAPSVLKSLLKGRSADEQVAAWLATPDLDESIAAKEAQEELRKLVGTRLSLDLDGSSLDTWRAVTTRYVLGLEFRADLEAAAPRELDFLADSTPESERNARTIAQALRRDHALEYPTVSDRVADELRLSAESIDALALGSVDTFRFEESALLRRCGELVRDGEFARVGAIAAARTSSFWLVGSIERQAQWEVARLLAELGEAAAEVAESLGKAPMSASEWVRRYSTSWHRLDRAQRHLEALLPKLDDDPDERALAAVRQRYDEVLGELARGFVGALEAEGWAVDGQLQQTSIYDTVVAPTPGRVAYFLVDAMRYEMGAELAERLDAQGEVAIRAAIGVLPSITKTGMAALMPGAAASYDVVDAGGKLGARIDGAELSDRAARSSRIKARVPASEDLTLPEVLSLSKSKLQKRIGEADLVVVRSQEIDAIGEGGFLQARIVMDTVIESLVRAVRKLASVGIDRAVIASDHGHLFAAEDREEAMRIDAPGGAQVELHRRCWIGRGGTTPPGCVRVAARTLGNDTDLDFVFPRGIGVFKSGGDLSFHHGGPSLQELVIPVVTVRSTAAVSDQGTGTATLSMSDVPTTITNRIFSVKVAVASLTDADLPIKPMLLSDERTVGQVGLAVGGEHDRATDTVIIGSGGEVTIGFVLDDDQVTSVRIVIVDPATDAPLYRSPDDIPVQLGVH